MTTRGSCETALHILVNFQFNGSLDKTKMLGGEPTIG